MAVSCHEAFGHYLRTLRERRGLALDDVWTLSQTFPESLNKGYLSRCENGKQKLAFPKVVAISTVMAADKATEGPDESVTEMRNRPRA